MSLNLLNPVFEILKIWLFNRTLNLSCRITLWGSHVNNVTKHRAKRKHAGRQWSAGACRTASGHDLLSCSQLGTAYRIAFARTRYFMRSGLLVMPELKSECQFSTEALDSALRSATPWVDHSKIPGYFGILDWSAIHMRECGAPESYGVQNSTPVCCTPFGHILTMNNCIYHYQYHSQPFECKSITIFSNIQCPHRQLCYEKGKYFWLT